MMPLNMSGPNSKWKTPLAYAKRSLAGTEQRYKSEKAVVYGLETFHQDKHKRVILIPFVIHIHGVESS